MFSLPLLGFYLLFQEIIGYGPYFLILEEVHKSLFCVYLGRTKKRPRRRLYAMFIDAWKNGDDYEKKKLRLRICGLVSKLLIKELMCCTFWRNTAADNVCFHYDYFIETKLFRMFENKSA